MKKDGKKLKEITYIQGNQVIKKVIIEPKSVAKNKQNVRKSKQNV